MPRSDLRGAHVLVTGAGRGIGDSFVAALLDRGASRVYAAVRDPRTIADRASAYGPRLVPVTLDVTDADHVGALSAEIDQLDLLISNAGREGSGNVLTQAESDARDLFEVHLWGPWRLASAFAGRITPATGGFIFVQSIAALALSRRGPFYSASKAAATMMAAALREAVRDSGLTVTNVFPGFTDTGMLAGEEVPKANPRSTADRTLDAWLAGEANVFPDPFAELVHERMRGDLDEALSTPGAMMAELYASYVDGQPNR